MNPKLPKYLIPVMNDGSGNLYCIDTRFVEPFLVFWDHEIGKDQNGIYHFSEWVVSCCKESLIIHYNFQVYFLETGKRTSIENKKYHLTHVHWRNVFRIS
ncbi:hypothetical protein LEP1GSC041_1591 [Leptospira noguchii str. 2006001870]|nr:hypothetical protein LEP1GSC041_1591 [Leptospira noguchii str. 2006001870]